MSAPQGRPIIDVTTFSTLAKLAERYGLLVLHWARSCVETFVVQDENITYRYRAGTETISSEPPAPTRKQPCSDFRRRRCRNTQPAPQPIRSGTSHRLGAEGHDGSMGQGSEMVRWRKTKVLSFCGGHLLPTFSTLRSTPPSRHITHPGTSKRTHDRRRRPEPGNRHQGSTQCPAIHEEDLRFSGDLDTPLSPAATVR